jgi:DNA-binding NtrC family response regulator
LPPLRERADDIPFLAAHFLGTLAEVYRRERLSIGPAALRWLQALRWPGNVRQLRQWIERAVLVSDREVLEVSDFTSTAEMEPGADAREALPAVGSMTMDEIERAMILKSMRHHAGNVTRAAEALGLSRAALYRRIEKYGIRA